VDRSVEALGWSDLEPIATELLDEHLTREGVEGWLHRWSDLLNAYYERRAWLYRTHTGDAEDESAAEAYNAFVREVDPRVRRLDQTLRQKLLALDGYEPAGDHRVFVSHFRADVELFRDDNAALLAEDQAMASEYNRIVAGITVELDGKTLTIPQAERRLLENDRGERERAWRAVQEARLSVSGDLDTLFHHVVRIRRTIAANAGLPSFREYRWRELKRFDYTPADSLRLHDSIEAEVVPLIRAVGEERRRKLGVDRLRPWDLLVDPDGRSPLQPCERVEDLEEGLSRMFSRMDPELGRQFDSLRDGWLDLQGRRGKVPGLGYQMYFPKSRRAFIYFSVNGTHRDVWVMLHEAGHAFHALASAEENELFWNMFPGIEFMEFASQTMELLALPFLAREQGGFYSPEDAARARREGLDRALHQLPLHAQIDAFQHWLYADAPHDVPTAALDARWSALTVRFAPGVDWTGLEQECAKGWHHFGTIFMFPFYIIEYSIAWLGAIQVWRDSLEDPTGALRRYRAALALGGTRPLPRLFEAAGARFAFDRETVREQMRFVFEQR
jgi:oligoendopeptidase F